MKLTLTGQTISTQTAYGQRGKIRFVTKKARDLKKSYIEQVKQQYEGDVTDKPIDLTIKLYHGDKRARDIDNYSKFILDSMEGLVYENDKQIYRLCLMKFYDKEYPRAELDIHIIGA